MNKKKISIAPQATTNRINGQKYIFEGKISIWKVFSNQSRWHCEHDRIRTKCKDCNPITCEHGRIQHRCSDCFYECEVCGKSLCGLHHNNSYAESDYLEALDIVYQREGVEALSFQRLKELRLYYPLYRFGWNAKRICNRFGMTNKEWKLRRKKLLNRTKGTIDWNEDKVWEAWSQLVDKFGYVPTANEVRKEATKFASVFGYMKDYGIDMDAVRAKYPEQNYGPQFNQMTGLNKVGGMRNRSRWTESANGMRWHSRVEASVSNFLYARGISHQKGRLYDDDYAEKSEYSRGWYDIHFESIHGDIIDLEIWGNLDDSYMKKRLAKEKHNSENPYFLGIDWDDCTESGLTKVLQPYIGVIEPFIFDKPDHKIIQTAFWSDAPEIIETCRWLAEQQPDGRFPTEHWLRKRGEYKNREGETYNTLGIYIQKYVGGLIELRRILGEDITHYRKWTRESILIALDEWIQEYGIAPQAYMQRHKRHQKLDDEVAKYAISLAGATKKHVGSFEEAMQILDYSRKNRLSKWEKGSSYKKLDHESTLIALDEWMQEYGISPQAYYVRHKKHNNLDEETFQYSKNLNNAIQTYLGSFGKAMEILGYTKTSRSTWEKENSEGPPLY